MEEKEEIKQENKKHEQKTKQKYNDAQGTML